MIQARSDASILREARTLTGLPGFKGYIHDVGGPTANFHSPACSAQLSRGSCPDRDCLWPEPCAALETDQKGYFELLKKVRSLPGVKKVFVRSGIHYDYLLAARDPRLIEDLCEHHVSGQLKVAPEHVSPRVLALMRKPGKEAFLEFMREFDRANRKSGKEQYLVPYLMSSHPGSTLADAVELALFLKEIRYHPEQVQDFIPTPGTLSTCMFYTGLDPLTGEEVYVPRSAHERKLQRALLQYRSPANRKLIEEALVKAGGRTSSVQAPTAWSDPWAAGPGGRGAPARGGGPGSVAGAENDDRAGGVLHHPGGHAAYEEPLQAPHAPVSNEDGPVGVLLRLADYLPRGAPVGEDHGDLDLFGPGLLPLLEHHGLQGLPSGLGMLLLDRGGDGHSREKRGGVGLEDVYEVEPLELFLPGPLKGEPHQRFRYVAAVDGHKRLAHHRSPP